MRCFLLIVTLLVGFQVPTIAQDSVAENTITLESRPEGVTAAWPYVRHFYVLFSKYENLVDAKYIQIVPEKYKLDFISPLLLIIGGLGLSIVSILFLIKQFQVHWGWGVGQLIAGVASFIVNGPSLIVLLVFLFLHWHKAFNLFMLGFLFWAILILSIFMIPTWAPTAAGVQLMRP